MDWLGLDKMEWLKEAESLGFELTKMEGEEGDEYQLVDTMQRSSNTARFVPPPFPMDLSIWNTG